MGHSLSSFFNNLATCEGILNIAQIKEYFSRVGNLTKGCAHVLLLFCCRKMELVGRKIILMFSLDKRGFFYASVVDSAT